MNQAKEFIYKYSEYSQCINTPNCTISLFIEERLESPVFFWYQLGSFYQNHKQYIKSSKIQDTDQEIGEFPEACFPFFTNKEAGRNISITNISLSPDDSVIPCGIAANTFFNGKIKIMRKKWTYLLDTFTMKTIQGTDVFLNSTGISYESRHGYTIPNIDLSKQWINMENGKLHNFLKTFPKLKKIKNPSFIFFTLISKVFKVFLL